MSKKAPDPQTPGSQGSDRCTSDCRGGWIWQVGISPAHNPTPCPLCNPQGSR